MNSDDPNPLAAGQRTLNRTSAGRWELFRSHRERLTEFILGQMGHGSSRVCVLGAGNCNDIDLARLVAAGAEIDLTDIDEEALERAAGHHAVPAGSIRLHGGIDITGIWPALTELRGRPPSDAEFACLVELAEEPPPLPLPRGYDVVVSPALLTQLIQSAAACVGEDHPQLESLALAIRAGHIDTLLRLLRPGGRALVITEIISNRELPVLLSAADEELPDLALQAVVKQDVYTATNPAAIVSWLIQHRPLGGRLRSPGIVGPWRWWLSGSVCYLVVGLLLTRR